MSVKSFPACLVCWHTPPTPVSEAGGAEFQDRFLYRAVSNKQTTTTTKPN